MFEDSDILEATAGLSNKERAAALAHWVYTETARAGGSKWSMRVPEAWDELDDRARAFNLASVETWARDPQVLEAWVAAVKASHEQP
jgi:hypothetical protein